MADEDSYCGTKWMDAYTHCHRRCDPDNNDAECQAALGPDYACQTFTLCTERIASGDVVPKSPSLVTGDSSETPPAGASDPSSGAGAGEGSSAQDTPPMTSDEADGTDEASDPTQEEYWYSEMVDGTPGDGSGGAPSGGSAQTPQEGGGGELGKMWYLKTDEYMTACTYGDDYPPAFAEIEALREKFIFDAIDDCCDTYPTACGRPEPVATTSPTIFVNATEAPSTAKPSEAPTYAPTMLAEDDDDLTEYEVMEGNGAAMPGAAWGVIAAVLLGRALRL